MKQYYRVMLGAKSVHAEGAYRGNYIGVDYDVAMDLSHKLPDNWREFNKEFIPKYLDARPDKSKIAAGLACGAIWTVAKGINMGDVVLCPNGEGEYYVGEVTTGYSYQKDNDLPHRRGVRWFAKTIVRSQMSQPLQYSTGATNPVVNITQYADEIENLISGARAPTIVSTDESVENPIEFALEKHLEDFLVQNWQHTELGKGYNILEEEGEPVGQQYPTDTGPIDILAVSKDKKELLVVELKRGRSSDAVVGQILRYMGFVKEELAEEGQFVKGVIIAHEEDQGIRRALSATQNIDFYVYRVNFKLVKSQA